MWLKVQCVKCSCDRSIEDARDFLMWEDTGDPQWVLLDTYKEGILPGSARLRNTDAVDHDAKITEAVVQKIKQTCTISFGK